MKFTVKGEGAKVVIDVKRRNYPDSDDYWDGNWLNADIEVMVPGYHASFNGNIRTEEVLGFLEGCKGMYQKLSGHVELNSMEKIIELRGEINKTGKIAWAGKTVYPVGIGACLSFGFESDQTFLPHLVSELDVIMGSFPVKGKQS